MQAQGNVVYGNTRPPYRLYSPLAESSSPSRRWTLVAGRSRVSLEIPRIARIGAAASHRHCGIVPVAARQPPDEPVTNRSNQLRQASREVKNEDQPSESAGGEPCTVEGNEPRHPDDVEGADQ